MSGRNVFFLVALMFLSGCTRPIDVTAWKIEPKDIQLRQKVLKISNPKGEHLEVAAEMQLKRAFLYRKILEMNGQPVGLKELKQEEARIAQETLMPDTLHKIQKIFEGNNEDYLKNYILPTYVERVIYYDFFLNNVEAQKEAKSKVRQHLDSALKTPEKFSKKVLSESAFTPYYAQAHLKTLQFFIADPARQKNRDKASFEEVPAPQIDKIFSHLTTRPKNKVINEIFENAESYWLVKIIAPNRKDITIYDLDIVIFPKADYSKWLAEQTAKIKAQ